MYLQQLSGGRAHGLRSRSGWLLLLAAPLLLVFPAVSRIGSGATAVAAGRAADTRPISELTAKFTDLEATLRVTQSNPDELGAISQDFRRIYAMHRLTLLYKEPDKIRLEGKSTVLGTAVFVLNGAVRQYSVPKLKIHNTEHLQNNPSRRQSLLEFGGMLSAETLRFMKGQFVREEAVDGDQDLIFDMTYQGVDGGSHYRIWIDPKTHITAKREWYDANNALKATFYYRDPREIAPDVWLPSHVEMKGPSGVMAATIEIGDAKVNQGLADSLFTSTL